MNSNIEKIADAILYEGYMLYPYRPSAVKNRQRWNFGVLYPDACDSVQNGFESCLQQTECLVRGNESSAVVIKVRFLHAVSRDIGELKNADMEFDPSVIPDVEIVDTLAIGDGVLQSWQEAIERDVTLTPLPLADLIAASHRSEFTFAGGRTFEPIRNATEDIAAFFVRTREALAGCVEIRAHRCGDEVFRITVSTVNSSTPATSHAGREVVLLKCLLSAHTILSVTDGEFISLTDPPDGLQEVAAECRNIGTWPVLVGDAGTRDQMLSSPIILYDYPQVAPESAGDLFDGTEIDEILALRILTLSEDEKREIRRSDHRARQVLESTESMPMEHFAKLHGALRGMKPVSDSGAAAQDAPPEGGQ